MPHEAPPQRGLRAGVQPGLRAKAPPREAEGMKRVELKMADRRPKKKRYWRTPPALMEALQREFAFDFDACPFPRPPGFDGLKVPWGRSTWVNPPFTGISWTDWANKCIEEHNQGKTVVVAIPCFAGRGIPILWRAGAEWRMLGEVDWLEMDTGEPKDGSGRPTPTLLAVLRGKPQ